jgi:HAD superfamily hydrolase (TIGR01509 family)
MKALIFDLDGTLVDSVYAHVLAWQLALAEAGMPIEGWRLHRRMGMSGGLFKRAVMRELGRTVSTPRLKALDKRHNELFQQFLPKPRPLPGAVQLFRFLRQNKIVHGIATSNQRPHVDSSLKVLGVTRETVVVVEREDVARAKPEPDLFLECQERLGVEVKDCYVIGDAVWDLMAARRAGMLSVGLLSGGYGEDELVRAGAFRVFRDVADLHNYLDELGVLP